jgi:hypothetical protein
MTSRWSDSVAELQSSAVREDLCMSLSDSYTKSRICLTLIDSETQKLSHINSVAE